ncbi:hypothetical protein KIW84_010431 [Lathyrus oleraceus]|uniref:Uncharacterized protein n=1 Tax=Pisum sativum TaxID=3888 RepID=A0A9D4YKV7_PEA|nr:hypothetical protein KIW84_010431 [Pisum sativum]
MNGAKRFAEAVGCKNESVGERSALERSTRASRVGRSGSENVGLSNENIGENPMPRKPKDSSARKSSNDLQQEGTCTGNRHRWCRKVKEVGDLMTGKQATEASVNGGRNYNGPKASQKVTEACKGFLGPDGDWPSSAKAEGSLTARPTRRAGTKVGLSESDGAEWKGRRSTDKSYSRDNRLIFPKSSHRREGLAPRCRLFATWSCSRFQGLGCSPIKAVRELGSERRETVRSISGVGVRALRGPFPSTRGPGRTHLWCASYRANGKRWSLPGGQILFPYGDGAKEVLRIEGHGETSRFSLTIGVKWKYSNGTPGNRSSGDRVGPVAQRIRARGYEPRCRGFESLLAHNRLKGEGPWG